MKQFLIFFLLVTTNFANAQTKSPEILTNAKVISMVKAALPKAAIIKSIQSKAGNFDISTDALIALKKQGVSDDIITAMVDKDNKTELVAAKPVAPPVAAAPAGKVETKTYVSTKDCKFLTVKQDNGTPLQVIKTPAKVGNFVVGKTEGKYIMVYDTKMLLSMILNDSKNIVSLRIDSVQFLFDDNSVVALKPVVGLGQVQNKTTELKPHMTNLHLALQLEPDSRAKNLFTQKKLKLFRVLAEKDGQYADQLNDKQQAQLLQAFTCLQ